MKKTILKALFTVLCVAGLFGGTCAAANTEDTTWSYLSSNGSATVTYRKKDTSGNVYCYPKKGDTSLYVTVQGANNNKYNTSGTKCSNKVLLYKGTQYTIVNSVKSSDHNYTYARLRLDTKTSTSQTNSGVWSPDATKDYTVKK